MLVLVRGENALLQGRATRVSGPPKLDRGQPPVDAMESDAVRTLPLFELPLELRYDVVGSNARDPVCTGERVVRDRQETKMSGNDREPKSDAVPHREGGAVAAERRVYKKPQLRHLGSVRELTFGTGIKMTDGGGLPTGSQGLM